MRNKKRYLLFNLVLVVSSLVILLTLLNSITAHAPSSTMTANISFNETPLINKNVELTVKLLSVINATNTTANITLPSEIELISGSTQWNVSLIENVTSNHTITIKVNTTGNFSIETRARDPPSGESYMGTRKIVYLNVTDNDTSVSYIPPLDPMWNYTKFAINTSLDPANITFNSTVPNATNINESFFRELVDSPFNETNFSNGSASITVKGRFLFGRRNGNTVSTRFITVYLYDADTFSDDDFLGSALTDENGRFSIGPVSNSDGEGATQDIYVRFFAASSVGIIQSQFNNVYDAFTPRDWFENVPDGTIDIGNWLPPSSEPEPWWLYDDILSGWLFIANDASPSASIGSVTVEWPKNLLTLHPVQTDYHTDIEEIHLITGHANDRDVVLHEYGHHIMNKIYVQFPSNDCPSGGHNIIGVSGPNCAWTEGWANFVPLFIDNNPFFIDTTQVFSIDFEDDPLFPFWDQGDEVEGRVTASLWDLSDDSSEDDYNGNFNNDVWDTFEGQDDDTFSQYWTAWKNDHTSSEEDNALLTLAQNTIYYDEINCADGVDNDGDGFTDCADAYCTQGTPSQNGFCCGSGCSTNGGSCSDASTSGFTCSDGNCNTYSEACQNGERESNLVCSGTSLSCSGGSCEYGFGAPQWCDEINPGGTACESSPGSYDELACEGSGTNCYYEAEQSCGAPSGCDEKDENECSDNSGLQCEWHGTYDDNVVEECESTTCGAISQCDEQDLGYDYASCTTGGQTYFADQCSSSCQGEDRGDNICRSSAFAGGCTASSNCNELSPGSDLNTCNQAGQTYYEDECSNSCQYTDITSVFECTETGCSCTEPLCDGSTAGSNISTCSSGQTYFADKCTPTASGEDRGDNVCRSSVFASGCTADTECNGVEAGTGDCDATCNYGNPPNVTLVSPANNSQDIDGSVTFNCSATDDNNLVNITLYGNWGGWHANETKSLSGVSNSTTFTKTLTDGFYEWNCLAYDSASQNDWADINWTINISIIPSDPYKFNITNSSGTTVAWLGNEGNIVLKGNCTSGGTCTAPSDSFIIANSTDTTTAYIDNQGNLCIEKGDCSDQSATCNPTRDAFIIKNSSNYNMSYIDFDGDLCLIGKLFENSIL